MATVKLKNSPYRTLGSIKIGEILVHEPYMNNSQQVWLDDKARVFTRVHVPSRGGVPGTLIVELTDLSSQYFDQLVSEFSNLPVRQLQVGEIVELRN